MSKKKQAFFRSMSISMVLTICLIFGSYGIAKAYENTLAIGFGEYKKAVELGDGYIRILDFEYHY